MSNPRFSVIIPVFNVEQYITTCISSIIKQTYNSFELILIDDGSTDASGDLCKQWASLDSRIIYFKQENGGPNKARNFALNLITGQYVIFVDADDWIEATTLETLQKYLLKKNYDIINFGFDFFEDNSKLLRDSKSYDFNEFQDSDIIMQALLGLNISGVCWNKCFNSNLFQDGLLRFIPDNMHARDILFTRQVALRSKLAAVVPGIFYHSRCRSESFSRTFGVRNIYSALDLADKHLEAFGSICNGKFLQVTQFSIGKHLRYILLLNSFRASSYQEFIKNFEIVRLSRFWFCVLPNKKLFHLYARRDYLLSLVMAVPLSVWLIAKVFKLFGFKPY